MSTRKFLVMLLGLIALLQATSANAEWISLTVTNPEFDGGITGWTQGWGVNSGWDSPNAPGSPGGSVYMGDCGVYQYLTATVAPDTDYRITASNMNYNDAQAYLGFQFGGIDFNINFYPAGTAGYPGTWTDWTLTVTAAELKTAGVAVGTPIMPYVFGATWTYFDHIRVEANTVPVPPDPNRGDNILLARGFQLSGITTNAAAPFHADTFTGAHFNTADFYTEPFSDGGGLNGPLTGMRFNMWDPDTNDADSTIPAGIAAYVNNLVGYQFSDEQDLSVSGNVTMAANWLADARGRYPNVLSYVNQSANSQYVYNTMRTFMNTAKPDMLMMDSYPFLKPGQLATCPPGQDQQYHLGGSPSQLYTDLQNYRKLALEGNDGTGSGAGTGTNPIPYGVMTQSFGEPGTPDSTYPRRMPSDSEIRLNKFAAAAFGYKWINSFVYSSGDSSSVECAFFTGEGDSTPKATALAQITETNRQLRNLGTTLVRLLSTDVRFIPGQHGSPAVDNATPIGMQTGTGDAYITSITAQNLGTLNNGLKGDVIVGYFKPLIEADDGETYTNEKYFMIMNGLSDASLTNGTVGNTKQKITINFNFGTSGITSLKRLDRSTGQVETVALTSTGGTTYKLELTLDGGTGDLFKFNDGAPFIPQEMVANGDLSSGSITPFTADSGTVTVVTDTNSPFTNVYPAGAGSINVYDANDGSSVCRVWQGLNNISGGVWKFNYDFKYTVIGDYNHVIYIANSEGTSIAQMIMGESGNGFYINDDGGKSRITTLSAGTWYNVQATIDLNNDTWSGSITPYGSSAAAWSNRNLSARWAISSTGDSSRLWDYAVGYIGFDDPANHLPSWTYNNLAGGDGLANPLVGNASSPNVNVYSPKGNHLVRMDDTVATGYAPLLYQDFTLTTTANVDFSFDFMVAGENPSQIWSWWVYLDDYDAESQTSKTSGLFLIGPKLHVYNGDSAVEICDLTPGQWYNVHGTINYATNTCSGAVHEVSENGTHTWVADFTDYVVSGATGINRIILLDGGAGLNPDADFDNFSVKTGGTERVVNGDFETLTHPTTDLYLDNFSLKPVALKPGDANYSNFVNLIDFAALAASYGTTSGAIWVEGDFNHDGAVNFADVAVLAANWLQ